MWEWVRNGSEGNSPDWSWGGGRAACAPLPNRVLIKNKVGKKKIGCWVKEWFAVLSSKTLKSETPYSTWIISVYFCVCLKFSITKNLKNIFLGLEFQEIGETIIWSRANAYLISQWVLGMKTLLIDDFIWKVLSEYLMIEELILRGRT